MSAPLFFFPQPQFPQPQGFRFHTQHVRQILDIADVNDDGLATRQEIQDQLAIERQKRFFVQPAVDAVGILSAIDDNFDTIAAADSQVETLEFIEGQDQWQEEGFSSVQEYRRYIRWTGANDLNRFGDPK